MSAVDALDAARAVDLPAREYILPRATLKGYGDTPYMFAEFHVNLDLRTTIGWRYLSNTASLLLFSSCQ